MTTTKSPLELLAIARDERAAADRAKRKAEVVVFIMAAILGAVAVLAWAAAASTTIHARP